MIQAPAPSAGWLLQSPVNPKPCGTFSWPTSKSPLSPFSMATKSLLLPKLRGKKKHPKTSWSSSFPLRTLWYSPLLLQNHMDLYLSTCFRTSWVYSFLQSHMVSFTLWLPGLGLNPSAHLPLQPISDSYSQLHLPASPYSSSFTGLP